MTIGALNSGARVWMADFEDATSPTWFNIIDGQLNLYDAIRRQIDFIDTDGRRHELGRRAGDDHGASAWLAPDREPPGDGRPADSRSALWTSACSSSITRRP